MAGGGGNWQLVATGWPTAQIRCARGSGSRITMPSNMEGLLEGHLQASQSNAQSGGTGLDETQWKTIPR